ncbi:RNA polymerase sigma factor [Hymenobacter psoromatis]|uniref:RNA polymerase sigma factor n=1 Tax=Hymenobacter psoromatis TaxID=1484116 RepID=UPI001CBF6E93|nr:sigma-70 family RNA polymerase sigma factor [Hymenobacter psoromatis]
MKTLKQEDESQLVSRLHARDEKAMAHFYKNYKSALYHTIWRIVRQDELAEDLLQECMLKFWVAFPTYDTHKGRLFTWALQIGRNLALDSLRDQRRKAQFLLPFTEAATIHKEAPTTFRPEHIGVRDWLNLLTPSDRRLLELLYLEGYSQSEAAEELSLPLGTVKTRAGRIIRNLTRVVA